jgi:hypothetical protein
MHAHNATICLLFIRTGKSNQITDRYLFLIMPASLLDREVKRETGIRYGNKVIGVVSLKNKCMSI